MGRAAVLALALAAAAAPAAAFRLTDRLPLFVRLEGRVGPPQEVTRGAADWEIALEKGRLRFQLTRLAVMSGEATQSDVVNALAPYRPQVRVHGPTDMLAMLSAATPADDVSMLGYVVGVPGTTQLMISQVTVTPPVPAGTPAAKP